LSLVQHCKHLQQVSRDDKSHKIRHNAGIQIPMNALIHKLMNDMESVKLGRSSCYKIIILTDIAKTRRPTIIEF